MARLSRVETEKKKKDSKNLFLKGFEYSDIAEIVELSETTIRKWGGAENWENEKQSNVIALSEIRNTLLDSFKDMKDGRLPSIDPLSAMRYANAFEKLSNKKKTLTYMFEAYEILTAEFLIDIQQAKTPSDKNKALYILKIIREKTDIVISRTRQEVLGNER